MTTATVPHVFAASHQVGFKVAANVTALLPTADARALGEQLIAQADMLDQRTAQTDLAVRRNNCAVNTFGYTYNNLLPEGKTEIDRLIGTMP